MAARSASSARGRRLIRLTEATRFEIPCRLGRERRGHQRHHHKVNNIVRGFVDDRGQVAEATALCFLVDITCQTEIGLATQRQMKGR